MAEIDAVRLEARLTSLENGQTAQREQVSDLGKQITGQLDGMLNWMTVHDKEHIRAQGIAEGKATALSWVDRFILRWVIPVSLASIVVYQAFFVG